MPTYVVLSHHTLKTHLHDVGGNDGLVVLSPGDLTQIQQVPDDCDQEPVLLLLQHGATDGANGPAQGVQTIPGQLAPILQSGLHANSRGSIAVQRWHSG